MYVKLFSQIMDSSITEDYLVRWVFTDLLILADSEGYVDMTHQAIAARTRVPEDIVRRAIDLLGNKDAESRDQTEEGRRIIKIDNHRSWGWRIVNYLKYRAIRTADERREYMRSYMRVKRSKQTVLNTGKQLLTRVSSVSPSEAEAEAEEESITPIVPSSGSETRRETTKATSADASFAVFWKHAWRKDAKQAAHKAWRKQCVTSAILQSVLDAVIAQSAYYLAREPDKRPYMSTWLNQQRWKDELGADPAQTIPLQKTRLQRIMESI